jgi:hypothetical protein
MKLTHSFALACLLVTGTTALQATTMEEMAFGVEELEILSRPVDSNAHTSCVARNEMQSKLAFQCAASRLSNVNNWSDLISVPGNKFLLRDRKGNDISRAPRTGDLIEIRLPLDPTGRSYWVKIEALNSRSQMLSIRVRPTANPKLPEVKGVTDHFFADSATNTFTIRQTGTELSASVNGRDEEANTFQARSRFDAMANQAIALSAWGVRRNSEAVAGLQPMVWKSFTKSLASCEKIRKLCPEMFEHLRR